jgi:hypothetical protein
VSSYELTGCSPVQPSGYLTCLAASPPLMLCWSLALIFGAEWDNISLP